MTFMLWRVGTRWLLRTEERSAAVYLLVDESGVVGRFADGSSSDEDDLWQWQHRVVDGALHKRTTMERYSSSRTSGFDKDEDEVVLDGLSGPVDDTAALALVVRAIAAHDARADSAADARVAATGASLDARDLPPHLARAHAALVHRVRSYDDPLASTLLRTLVDVARARASTAVCTAYARACLLACFENDVPALLAVDAPARGDLAASLAACARELDAAADGQEMADAMNNARVYRTAAAALRAASVRS